MTKEARRIGIGCAKCDHSIVTLPEAYHFSGTLTYPGRGETFELPEKAKGFLERTGEGPAITSKGPDRNVT